MSQYIFGVLQQELMSWRWYAPSHTYPVHRNNEVTGGLLRMLSERLGSVYDKQNNVIYVP